MSAAERDTRDLDAAPTLIKDAYTHRGTWRVYLVTTYPDGSTWHRTGYVGKTTGHRPAYLLVTNSRALGSSDLLDAKTWSNTQVMGVQRGAKWGYYLGSRRVFPGRNRFEESPECVK